MRSYSDALAGEDFRASSMVIEVAPNGESPGYRSFGLPYELCDTPRRPTQAAPAHGAHTEEVLREAGFGAEEIEMLRQAVKRGAVRREGAPQPRARHTKQLFIPCTSAAGPGHRLAERRPSLQASRHGHLRQRRRQK